VAAVARYGDVEMSPRHAPRRVLAVAFLAFTLAGPGGLGCGDGGPGDDQPPVDHGVYADPEDFPRDGCQPGGFAGVDVQGIYHFEVRYEGDFTFPTVARIDGDGGGVVVGRVATQVVTDDDDLVLQYAGEGGVVRAIDLCARAADGTVRGWYASCPGDDQPDQECYTLPLSGLRVERLDEPEAVKMTRVGEYGPWDVGQRDVGVSVNVRVADQIAYLARYQDGLRIVDVHDPAHPVELGHQAVEIADGEIWNDVKIVDGPGIAEGEVSRRYALMASNQVGVVVVDVTAPGSPSIVGHLSEGNVHTLFVDAGKAYLTCGDHMEIWDVADPRAATLLGAYTHPGDGYVHDLYVSGDRAYLNHWELGMVIVDVSNPAAPTLVGTFADYGEHTSHSSWVTQVGARKIAVHGDEQWGAHVHIVDVTEGTAAFATGIGEWQTRPEVSVHNVMAFGDRAYVAHYQDGIRILDLSNPAAPTEIAHFDTWPGYDRAYGYSFYEGAIGLDVDLSRALVYVADSHRGLLVLRIDG